MLDDDYKKQADFVLQMLSSRGQAAGGVVAKETARLGNELHDAFDAWCALLESPQPGGIEAERTAFSTLHQKFAAFMSFVKTESIWQNLSLAGQVQMRSLSIWFRMLALCYGKNGPMEFKG